MTARGATGGSVEEVIRRLRAYKEAGVIVLYPEAREEVRAAHAAVEGVMMGTLGFLDPPPSLSELTALDYPVAFYPICVSAPEYVHPGSVPTIFSLAASQRR